MRKQKFFAVFAMFAALTFVAAACGDDEGDGTGGTGPTDTTVAPWIARRTSSAASRSRRENRSSSRRCSRSRVTRRSWAPTATTGSCSRSTTWTARSTGRRGSSSATTSTSRRKTTDARPRAGSRARPRLRPTRTVVAVIGTSCSSAALGVADTILGDGILLVSPSNTNPGLTSEEAHQPFYARTAHNDKIQGAIVAEFVFNELGITRPPRSTTRARTQTASRRRSATTSRRWRNDHGDRAGATAAIRISGRCSRASVRASLGRVQSELPPVCGLTITQGVEILPEGTSTWARTAVSSRPSSTRRGHTGTYYASSPDVTVFQGGAFYRTSSSRPTRSRSGPRPTSVLPRARVRRGNDPVRRDRSGGGGRREREPHDPQDRPEGRRLRDERIRGHDGGHHVHPAR